MKRKKLHHFFLPHHKTHKKAHLLSIHALSVYIFFFVTLQFGFQELKTSAPGVLGTTTAITSSDVVSLTNKEREKYGLSLVKENKKLDEAAEEKAKNMFDENYWAHESPSGKTPWVWFKKAGYDYRYAGENLARDFYQPQSVIDAWMASKMGHRENLLNYKYQEIGVAVEDGILDGRKTTLVVQLFGTDQKAVVAKPKIDEGSAKVIADNSLATDIPTTKEISKAEVKSTVTRKSVPTPSALSAFVTIDPYRFNRIYIISIITLIALLSALDIYVLKRRNAFVKLHVRHIPHMAVGMGLLIIFVVIRAGNII